MDFLNHAITVGDALYVGMGVFVLIVAISAAVHPPYVERRRLKRMQRSENLRNPVYGTPSKPRP